METPPLDDEISDEPEVAARPPHGRTARPDDLPARRDREAVVVIDRRRLLSQCMEVALRLADPGTRFATYTTLDEWRAKGADQPAGLVVLCADAAQSPEAELAELRRSIGLILGIDGGLGVVVSSDCECPHQVVQALEAGARGYVPTSTSLDVAVRAFQLVRAGGVYVPASILSAVSAAKPAAPSAAAAKPEADLFSPRQLRVARALRMGVPNKIIAYELNMCESTVKVHVRNIMKKLKARNRTEVAFLTNHLFSALDGEHAATGAGPGALNGHRPAGDVADGPRHS